MKTVLCFLCFSLLGWISLFLGLRDVRRHRARMARETLRTEGVVTGYETKPMSWGRGAATTAYYPVVSFTVSGHAYAATADDYFLPPLLEGDPERPPEGSAVTLYCDPDNPMRFHLEQPQEVRDEGMIRIGKYIIAFALIVSVFCAVVLKW